MKKKSNLFACSHIGSELRTQFWSQGGHICESTSRQQKVEDARVQVHGFTLHEITKLRNYLQHDKITKILIITLDICCALTYLRAQTNS